VRLVRKRVLYSLRLKEGAQRNVEIAYCNCKIPFQLRDILHCSGKLVTIARFAVTQRDCTFCPYTGDIFAIKTEDSKLKKIFTRWFKFDIHVGIFSFLVSTVFSV
jgi:hypothetical protein